jgi:hypothetical protein
LVRLVGGPLARQWRGAAPTARTILIRPYLNLSLWRFQWVIKEQPPGVPLYLVVRATGSKRRMARVVAQTCSDPWRRSLAPAIANCASATDVEANSNRGNRASVSLATPRYKRQNGTPAASETSRRWPLPLIDLVPCEASRCPWPDAPPLCPRECHRVSARRGQSASAAMMDEGRKRELYTRASRRESTAAHSLLAAHCVSHSCFFFQSPMAARIAVFGQHRAMDLHRRQRQFLHNVPCS